MLFNIIMALTIGLAGVVIIWMGWSGAREQLPLNGFAGLKTRAIMESEESWRIAHKAAGTYLMVGGVGCIVGAIAMLFVGEGTVTFVAMISTGWTLLWIIIATVMANKAIS